MKKLKLYVILFLTMFKIGLFTFGGGYAMITLLGNEFVTRKKWIDESEFMDIVAIAESTPGPVAVNSATYVGYRTAGVIGSVICTLAVCMPSFIIIYLISLFFNAFIQLEYVAYAFEGIQACVIFLILAAGIKMIVRIKKSVFNIVVFIATFTAMITLSVLAIDFSSIYYVLLSAATGFIVYSAAYAKKRLKERKACGICAGECTDGAKKALPYNSAVTADEAKKSHTSSEESGDGANADISNDKGTDADISGDEGGER